jgi:methionyl aminopeptidase
MRKISRNDLCWCGSGIKYKKCHMDDDIVGGRKISAKTIKPPAGVIIKTKEQIQGIRKSCRLTKDVLDMVEEHIKEGLTTNEINDLVHLYTIKHGAIPATLNYNGFPKSVCTSINNVVCHGIPDVTILKNGDIVNVDVTCILDGYFGDSNRMFCIGEVSPAAEKLVRVARECLYVGIEHVHPYKDMGEIGYAIEQHAKANGFSVVRDYGGHGVGLKFHEDPHVHHYGGRARGIYMVPGMTFTIEPMINAGRYETELLADDWTAVTADGSLSAQWEHTLLVTEDGVETLTE